MSEQNYMTPEVFDMFFQIKSKMCYFLGKRYTAQISVVTANMKAT